MGYAGPLAIHLAQCSRQGVDYTYWPGILIPYLKPTIPTLKTFYLTWIKGHSIRAAIDEVVGSIEQEVSICFSSAYRFLAYIVRALLLNCELLSVRAPSSVTAMELHQYRSSDVCPLFEGEMRFSPASPNIFVPP